MDVTWAGVCACGHLLRTLRACRFQLNIGWLCEVPEPSDRHRVRYPSNAFLMSTYLGRLLDVEVPRGYSPLYSRQGK